MPLGNFSANGQTNPGAWVFGAAMKALKNGEDSI
jgi:hypothetical protein